MDSINRAARWFISIFTCQKDALVKSELNQDNSYITIHSAVVPEENTVESTDKPHYETLVKPDEKQNEQEINLKGLVELVEQLETKIEEIKKEHQQVTQVNLQEPLQVTLQVEEPLQVNLQVPLQVEEPLQVNPQVPLQVTQVNLQVEEPLQVNPQVPLQVEEPLQVNPQVPLKVDEPKQLLEEPKQEPLQVQENQLDKHSLKLKYLKNGTLDIIDESTPKAYHNPKFNKKKKHKHH